VSSGNSAHTLSTLSPRDISHVLRIFLLDMSQVLGIFPPSCTVLLSFCSHKNPRFSSSSTLSDCVLGSMLTHLAINRCSALANCFEQIMESPR